MHKNYPYAFTCLDNGILPVHLYIFVLENGPDASSRGELHLILHKNAFSQGIFSLKEVVQATFLCHRFYVCNCRLLYNISLFVSNDFAKNRLKIRSFKMIQQNTGCYCYI